MAPIIHLVEDDESFRRSVMTFLVAAGYEVRAYTSADEFLLARPANTAGCVVLDVHMPGTNGLELQAALGGRGDALPIIFLTGGGDIPMSVRAMKAGAMDFLTKPVQPALLLSAVQTALARDAENRTARATESVLRQRYETLTPRERDVFALMVAGKLSKQIAAQLGTTVRTIKAHRAQVMAKMHAASVAELTLLAVQIRGEA